MRTHVDNTPTKVLYNSTTGSSSVTLPESASNFKFLIVSIEFTASFSNFINVIVIPGYQNSYIDLNYYLDQNAYGLYGPISINGNVVSCASITTRGWQTPKIYRIIGIR